MAVLLAFELANSQEEIRQELLQVSGFVDSLRGYSTRTSDEIETDLPRNVLFHPDYDMPGAMAEIRERASGFGVHIDSCKVVAIEVQAEQASGWRGVISRYRSQEE